jgi:cobalt-zinc-cadmium efflux system membrane fusion protein
MYRRGEVAPVRTTTSTRWVWFAASAFLLSCSSRAPKPDTVEKAAEPAANPGEPAPVVELSPEARGAAGIRVEPAGTEAFRPRLRTSGLVRPETEKSVSVRARTAGRVLRVFVDVGTPVQAGETLATLEGPDVTGALARYRTAVAREAVARKALERADRLLEVSAISRGERDARQADAEAAASEAEAARQEIERLGLDPRTAAAPGKPSEIRVTSPLAGTVLEKSVSPGLLVDKDVPLFLVAALDRVWAVMDVYEKDLGRVQVPGEAEVRSDAYPLAVFKGRLTLVEPAIDEGTRTAHARVVLDNRGGRLKPGLTVTADLPVHEGSGAAAREAVAVPADAVQKLSGMTAVFVEKEEGHYALTPVEVGDESGGLVEIRKGLAKGDRVVVSGAFVLKSELLKKSLAGEEG